MTEIAGRRELLGVLALVATTVVSVGLYVGTWSVMRGLADSRPTRIEELLPAIASVDGWLASRLSSWNPEIRPHLQAGPRFVIGVCGLLALYGIAMLSARTIRSGLALATVFGLVGLVQALPLLSSTMLSSDVYAYFFYGRVLSVYGANPYSEVPSRFPGDLYLPYVYWRDAPTYYGPIWTLLSWLLAAIGGESVGLTVTLFRALQAIAAVGAAGLCAAIVWRTAPAHAALAAVGLAYRRRSCWAVVAAMVAALVKPTLLILAPLIAIHGLWRVQGIPARARLAARMAVAGILVALAVTVSVFPRSALLSIAGLGPTTIGTPAVYRKWR